MTATTTSQLAFSIDLDAELRSMTERQHLNAVHFAVQLVRYALRQSPTRILLKSTAKTFSIEHDGRPFSDEERALLFQVLQPDGRADQRERQAALGALEAKFGVDLLGLLARSRHVDVFSLLSFEATDGKLAMTQKTRATGTKITVSRTRTSSRQERKELLFYARYADAELRLNGKRLDQKPTFAPEVCSASVVTEGARAVVRLRHQQGAKRVRYYKHGVYFGVRSTVPADGFITDARFNATTLTAEDNFRDSLRASVPVLRDARDRLIDTLASTYAELSISDFERAKQALLQMAREAWRPTLRAAPLFDAVGRARSYSFNALAQRATAGVLFYAPSDDTAGQDPHLPALSAAEAAALSRLLRVPARPVLDLKPPSLFARLFARFSRPKAIDTFPPLPDPTPPSPAVADLARQLHEPGIFTLAFTQSPGVDRSLLGARVRLSPRHPALQPHIGRPLSQNEKDALRVQLEFIAANAEASSRI